MSTLTLDDGSVYQVGQPAPAANGGREPVTKAARESLIKEAAYLRKQVELTEGARELNDYYKDKLIKAEQALGSA